MHLFLNFEAFQLAYREKTINNVLHTNTFNKKAVTVERKSMFPSQTILAMAGTSETRCLLFLSIKPRWIFKLKQNLTKVYLCYVLCKHYFSNLWGVYNCQCSENKNVARLSFTNWGRCRSRRMGGSWTQVWP